MPNSERVRDLSRQTYLTPEEAAEYLRITLKGLSRRKQRGTIPAWCYTRLGVSVRYIRKALDELLQVDARDAVREAAHGGRHAD